MKMELNIDETVKELKTKLANEMLKNKMMKEQLREISKAINSILKEK